MLHRKIYQLCCDGREVCIFLRDQQRWIERARILDIEGDLVTLRYELDEEDEISAWEELVRLDSIGSISQKISGVSRLGFEPAVSDDCPEAERLDCSPMLDAAAIKPETSDLEYQSEPSESNSGTDA
jgi:hypothetical protein